MAYTSDIVYDRSEAARSEGLEERRLPWSQQRLFLSLFLIGTIIAAAGWFAEWQQLALVISFFRYSVIITIVGHGLEVIGAFGMMLTPDYYTEDAGDYSQAYAGNSENYQADTKN